MQLKCESRDLECSSKFPPGRNHSQGPLLPSNELGESQVAEGLEIRKKSSWGINSTVESILSGDQFHETGTQYFLNNSVLGQLTLLQSQFPELEVPIILKDQYSWGIHFLAYQ